jgi:hypothetical protein
MLTGKTNDGGLPLLALLARLVCVGGAGEGAAVHPDLPSAARARLHVFCTCAARVVCARGVLENRLRNCSDCIDSHSPLCSRRGPAA